LASPPKIKLGAFAAGEVPRPLVHQFLDYDNSPVDLTGGVATFNVESIPPVTGPLGGSAVIQDPVNGLVRYEWSDTDMATPADYTAQLWVDLPVYQYASDPILYTVYDGPGDAP
jgi:hypothetical protein